MSLIQKETAEYAFDLQVGLNGTDVPEFDAARLLGNAAVLAVNLRVRPETHADRAMRRMRTMAAAA